MNHVFVGDIHGKVARVQEALDKDGKVIFVGDFMDSWDDNRPNTEQGSRRDQGRCLDLVIEAIRKGKADACWGNHELSYLRPTKHRCGGYSKKKDYMIRKRASAMHELFKPFIFVTPELLVSHAGLTNSLWETFSLGSLGHDDLVKKLWGWWENMDSPMHWIGHTRGGIDPDGGIFWCDFNFEHEPISGLYQIFGHTRGEGLRRREKSFCIDSMDSRDPENAIFLEIDL